MSACPGCQGQPHADGVMCPVAGMTRDEMDAELDERYEEESRMRQWPL